MTARPIITTDSENIARLRPTKGIGVFIAAVSVSRQRKMHALNQGPVGTVP
jgi:hypothetical protein